VGWLPQDPGWLLTTATASRRK